VTGPHWMPVAWRELGVRELPGAPDAPRVVDYHQATTLKATDDEVPWCSAFVCWVLRAAHVPTTRSAAARSWLAWGRTVPERYGAVAVLSRGTNPAQGHVGFLVDADAASLWMIGGNQGDAVSVARFDRPRLLGLRWPIDA
jgi:uncharacterized protein (TIGR02594 family)